jgi:hypothetical protein
LIPTTNRPKHSALARGTNARTDTLICIQTDGAGQSEYAPTGTAARWFENVARSFRNEVSSEPGKPCKRLNTQALRSATTKHYTTRRGWTTSNHGELDPARSFLKGGTRHSSNLQTKPHHNRIDAYHGSKVVGKCRFGSHESLVPLTISARAL